MEALLKQYTQFLTIESLSDPRDQYVLGQQLTQLVLTFLPV
ncbi:MAG: hypothetical protein Q8O99_00870 [bacterium]|nr:hypothetical protein [bacterium]